MPLARYALCAGGIETYVATWDEGGAWIAAMRHIAAEGRCWVTGRGLLAPGRRCARRVSPAASSCFRTRRSG